MNTALFPSLATFLVGRFVNLFSLIKSKMVSASLPTNIRLNQTKNIVCFIVEWISELTSKGKRQREGVGMGDKIDHMKISGF